MQILRCLQNKDGQRNVFIALFYLLVFVVERSGVSQVLMRSPKRRTKGDSRSRK